MGRIVRFVAVSAVAGALALVAGAIVNGTGTAFSVAHPPPSRDAGQATSANALFLQGRKVFRYDTFGDQEFWGDTIQLHKAIEGAKLGGVGGGVSPKTALALGLKVDAAALPKTLVTAIKAGKVDLDSPATTLALIKLNAVVGVKGTFDSGGSLSSMGVTCALCHSTVDNSFAPGIGQRLDGWPNRDLNVGAIINAAPDHTVLTNLLGVDDATLGKVLSAWGPGRFDAEVTLDGKAFTPDGKTGAVLIPAAFGLAGVNLATYTGWGTVTYWNAFVANLEMHGQGHFHQRARLQPAHAVGDLHRQLHGGSLADGHVPDGAAARTLGAIEGRVLPRRPLPDLLSVVQHYNSCMNLGLSSGQIGDLTQFLKSR